MKLVSAGENSKGNRETLSDRFLSYSAVKKCADFHRGD